MTTWGQGLDQIPFLGVDASGHESVGQSPKTVGILAEGSVECP